MDSTSRPYTLCNGLRCFAVAHIHNTTTRCASIHGLRLNSTKTVQLKLTAQFRFGCVANSFGCGSRETQSVLKRDTTPSTPTWLLELSTLHVPEGNPALFEDPAHLFLLTSQQGQKKQKHVNKQNTNIFSIFQSSALLHIRFSVVTYAWPN